MSILVALLRDDFTALISDSRSVFSSGEPAEEDSQKIWELSSDVILAACGGVRVTHLILTNMQLAVGDMWPCKPQSFTDFISLLKTTVSEWVRVRGEPNTVDEIATFIVAGRNGKEYKLYSISTHNHTREDRATGVPSARVYIIPPAGLKTADYEAEFHRILLRGNLSTTHSSPQQLADAGMEAVVLVSRHNQYINNKCQVRILENRIDDCPTG